MAKERRAKEGGLRIEFKIEEEKSRLYEVSTNLFAIHLRTFTIRFVKCFIGAYTQVTGKMGNIFGIKNNLEMDRCDGYTKVRSCVPLTFRRSILPSSSRYLSRIESVKGADFGFLVSSTDVRNRSRVETRLCVVR